MMQGIINDFKHLILMHILCSKHIYLYYHLTTLQNEKWLNAQRYILALFKTVSTNSTYFKLRPIVIHFLQRKVEQQPDFWESTLMVCSKMAVFKQNVDFKPKAYREQEPHDQG